LPFKGQVFTSGTQWSHKQKNPRMRGYCLNPLGGLITAPFFIITSSTIYIYVPTYHK